MKYEFPSELTVQNVDDVPSIIKERREALNLPMMRLAVKSNLSQTAIHNTEAGMSYPTLRTFVRMMSALGYDSVTFDLKYMEEHDLL